MTDKYPRRANHTKANIVAACLQVLNNATLPHCAHMLGSKLRQKGYGGFSVSSEDIHKWMQQQMEAGTVTGKIYQDMPPHGDSEWRYEIAKDTKQ